LDTPAIVQGLIGFENMLATNVYNNRVQQALEAFIDLIDPTTVDMSDKQRNDCLRVVNHINRQLYASIHKALDEKISQIPRRNE
jgi:hypothetical protein